MDVNKKKIRVYGGSLCALSVISAVSVYLSKGEDASAMVRNMMAKLTSSASGLTRNILSTSGKITGLRVSDDPTSPVKKLVAVFDSENNTTKLYPGQGPAPKEKLLWKKGTYGVQKYTGSDGRQRRFMYKTSSSTTSTAPTSTVSSSTMPVALTSSVSSSSVSGAGQSTGSSTQSGGQSTSSGGTGTGSGKFTSRLNLYVIKEGDKVKFVEKDKVTVRNPSFLEQSLNIYNRFRYGNTGTSTTPVSSGGTSVSTSTQTPMTTTVTTSTQTTGIGTAPVQTPSSRAQTIVVTSTGTTPTSTVSPSLSTGTTSSISTGTTTATSSGSSTKTPTSSTSTTPAPTTKSTLSGIRLASPQPSIGGRNVIKLKGSSTSSTSTNTTLV